MGRRPAIVEMQLAQLLLLNPSGTVMFLADSAVRILQMGSNKVFRTLK